MTDIIIGAIVGAIVTLLFSDLGWPWIKDHFLAKHPDTFVSWQGDTIICQNNGKADDLNVSIHVGFNSTIQSIQLGKPERIQVLNGGVGGNYVVILIKELVPQEWDWINVTGGDGIRSINARSELNEKVRIVHPPTWGTWGPEETAPPSERR